jgi:glucosamine--fructose-6-phosphate aminotransferase (isomerizing)
MTSRMALEAGEVPATVARLLAADGERVAACADALRAAPPRALLTLARGSSDCAAHYTAYLVMARLGRLVTSLPMSLVTLYRARIDCDGLLALAFSQSGASPDLVEPMREFVARGAQGVAFVNDAGSPLAAAAGWVFPLHAGAETSVAATKSCVAQMAAGARFVAAWQGDAALARALAALPPLLDSALALAPRWAAAALPALAPAERALVIGRGTGLALAMEAALKLKEVCGLHAEALSGAELRHGPLALIEPGYPVLLFAPRGPAQAGLLALAADLRARGAHLLLAAPAEDAADAALPLATSADADLDPIAALVSLYPMVEALAAARGRDPDRPPHLSKVTRTR